VIRLTFPSPQFDEAVAAVCHGSASEEQARALNGLLRSDAAARDAYLLRLEMHSRLASEPDLFAQTNEHKIASPANILPLQAPRRPQTRKRNLVLALAACIALLITGWWALRFSHTNEGNGATSKAVAMLNRVADAQWSAREKTPRLGAPLEPGWVRLDSGLAQIVFYSGARVVLEGPAELQLISGSKALCRSGKLTAEVPPQAHGFRVWTPEMQVTDLGTAFGLDVKERRTELHVFKGSVEFQQAATPAKQNLREGAGVVKESSQPPKFIAADPGAFASLFELQSKSSAAEVLRHEQWRAASSRLDEDPSLLLHFDFEHADLSDWRLRNASARKNPANDATIVGCQWTEGRWPEKHALEFRSVSDRVRLTLPGEFESLTLAAWVRVQGLDRQFNSLFMSDGFALGTLHWLIRKDGVLGLTAIGARPGHYQIAASPSVLALDQYGIWLHLAVVLDGKNRRVTQFMNGAQVSEKALKVPPPFRIGAAELGNWNADGFPNNDPSLIRNFSGAMDEFWLFNRALTAGQIRALYSEGKPQPEDLANLKTN
jgi:hypothetical protein